MMQRVIERKRATQRSFVASVGIHAALLILLVVLAGRGAVEKLSEADELTQIAYIEAKYGEDIAKKVRMKTAKPAGVKPGPGIETRSAMKPKTPAPAAKQSETKQLVADVSAPKLQREDPTFAQLEREKLNSRTSLNVASPDLKPESVRREPSLAQAGGTPKLSSKVSGTPKLPESGRALVSRGKAQLDAGGPDVPSRSTSAESSPGEFDPQAPALQSRGNTVGPGSSFKPSGGSLTGRSDGKAALDVGGTAPTPGGGSSGSGRRTVLDYGSGGSGGGLAGKGGTLAGSPKAPSPAKQRDQSIAEAQPVKVAGKGSNMTITGQIAGRKILHSVSPEYSKTARKNGWEGVVAVHFTVLADGRVKDNMFFEQTSQHRDLNKAAMDAIKQFKFAPLPPNEAAVEQWGVITIVFRLN